MLDHDMEQNHKDLNAKDNDMATINEKKKKKQEDEYKEKEKWGNSL